MKLKTIENIDAYLAGMGAKERGEFKSSNPHKSSRASLYIQWDYGWDYGKVTKS